MSKKVEEANVPEKISEEEFAAKKRELEKSLKNAISGAYKRGTAEGTRALGRIIMAVIDNQGKDDAAKIDTIKNFCSAAMRVRAEVSEE